ncbi:MAG: alpha/beta fold hydrolase [Mesorhizobium sp.]|uniref:alpha/beta fold hydrolase n=1 Tax=unclassified Mesorhizobium TaxID=325217 RepID=UPI000F762687|nr:MULTISPECIES: alpha/beta hydrolase [unclassified Mesorhizobium]AZO51329.1 alpha/beta hydrolase [Mesorhizobium sp. M4B.F.Ca.ET.058.02.1.1]RVC40850.1 alpha/beta fold hydrolase [Mesorhizobium sp. M4A.F.Ca.ET.090.04.2.1]RWC52720.1 MAG: alpha/beta fold hydrolase [Mesorhizobium sp.]RWD18288.1 MAG: alpha/beta fold hydrolase [Mesorhizobium sp.]RWD57970.1 MAG: alpha/beta fold hydrolase [Mesorhizobium sp.]
MPSIDYVEDGSGPPVLFVPGSFSTHAAWRPMQKWLAPGHRMIGTSLCGYGATAETRGRDDFGMRHELRIIEHAARRAGEPVHLVGHSFGGTVALAAALANSIDVASLSLFEANPLALLDRQSRRDLYDAVLELSREFIAAVDAGEADAAAMIIDFWGGPGTFAAMPEAVRDYCRKTAATNAIDWLTDFGFGASVEDYRALDIPVLLVRGEFANPAMVAMTDLLEQTLPDARGAIVDGAGHFLIATHAQKCAALLRRFLTVADAALPEPTMVA